MKIVEKIRFKARLNLFYFLVNIRRFVTGMLKPRLISSDIDAFKRKGFIRADFESFQGISAELLPVIDELKSTGAIKNPNYVVIGKNDFGVKAVAIDINEEFLWEHVLTKELFQLIRGYYGRNFFLRNSPTIEFSYDGEVNDAQKFHLDWGLQQVSLMINLTDVLPVSTHMEYLTGSNKKYYFSQPHRDSVKSRLAVKGFKSAYPENLETTVGVSDSAFIFDAGNGFHRQVAGGARIMLHLNFVENLAFTYWDSEWQPPAVSRAYWFSDVSNSTQKYIKRADLPITLLDLVNKKCGRKLGIPRIYCHSLG